LSKLWREGEKPVSEIDIKRILTHVSGCLYFYGAMYGRDLYEGLREFGEMEMVPYAKFSQLVRSYGALFSDKKERSCFIKIVI